MRSRLRRISGAVSLSFYPTDPRPGLHAVRVVVKGFEEKMVVRARLFIGRWNDLCVCGYDYSRTGFCLSLRTMRPMGLRWSWVKSTVQRSGRAHE